MSSVSATPWLRTPRSGVGAEPARARLFCFAHAGGDAGVFRDWPDRLPGLVEVCGVQLPGRGQRVGEAPYTRIEPLVRDLVDAILPFLDRPYIFFGHSMGALVAFELAHALLTRRAPMPTGLLVSGRRAPHLPPRDRDETPMYALSDAALVRALRRLRGTPDAVLQHQQYLEFLLPVVRADLAVCDTNQSRHQQLLACPIRAYAGEADSVVSTEELAEWQRDTAGSFEMTLFPGGHFFLYEESPDAFLSTLSDHLMQLVGSGCSLNAFTAS